MAKAKSLATNLGFSEDEQTSIDINWVNRFKQRRGIKPTRLHGEGAAANFKVIDKWKRIRIMSHSSNSTFSKHTKECDIRQTILYFI